MAAIRKAVDPVLARVLDRYVVTRAHVRSRLGLRPNKPWWQRPDAGATGIQLSIAANLLLVGIGVPVGFNAVMTSRGKEIAATRVAIDDKQIASDADQAILAALNERRDDDGLPRLCILPSQMTQEQLASAADADVSGASADDTHSGVLVHGVHVDAAPEWEVKLMKRCDELHAEALRRRADHQGLSHKTAGSVAKDPQEVLQEARRQGLDI